MGLGTIKVFLSLRLGRIHGALIWISCAVLSFYALPVEASSSEHATTIDQVLEGVSSTATVGIAEATTSIAVAEMSQSRSAQFPVVTVDAQGNVMGRQGRYIV